MFEFLEFGIEVLLGILELCFVDEIGERRRSGQVKKRPVETWVTR
jgi:hypothetical protein